MSHRSRRYQASASCALRVHCSLVHTECDNGGHLIISGDIHHYERILVGSSQQITAGGGGAFLHPSLRDPR